MADCAGSGDPGAMLAVFAPLDQVASLIREHGLDVVIANKNAPSQFVLSGPLAEIERAAGLFGGERINSSRWRSRRRSTAGSWPTHRRRSGTAWPRWI